MLKLIFQICHYNCRKKKYIYIYIVDRKRNTVYMFTRTVMIIPERTVYIDNLHFAYWIHDMGVMLITFMQKNRAKKRRAAKKERKRIHAWILC